MNEVDMYNRKCTSLHKNLQTTSNDDIRELIRLGEKFVIPQNGK